MTRIWVYINRGRSALRLEEILIVLRSMIQRLLKCDAALFCHYFHYYYFIFISVLVVFTIICFTAFSWYVYFLINFITLLNRIVQMCRQHELCNWELVCKFLMSLIVWGIRPKMSWRFYLSCFNFNIYLEPFSPFVAQSYDSLFENLLFV